MLDICICTDEEGLSISGVKSNLLIQSDIQLGEGIKDMTNVQIGNTVLIFLMEQIITEQLQQIAVSSFAPTGVGHQGRTFIDESKLDEHTKVSAIVDFCALLMIRGLEEYTK